MATESPGVVAHPNPSPRPLADALLSAIAKSKLSLYALATTTGVDAGTLGRFVRGECGLRLATVDRLFAALGLGVVREPNDTLQSPSVALRSWIATGTLGIFALSRASGVAHTTITKFVDQRAGLETVSADKIAAALDLRVVQGPRPAFAPPERPGDGGRPILDGILTEIGGLRLDAGELARITGDRKDKLDRLIACRGDVKLAVADLVCEAIGLGFIWKPGEPPAVPSVAIRRAIEASGLSSRKLANISGVVYQAIQGFMRRRVGIELVSADRLAAALGIVAARGPVSRPADPPAPVDPSIPYVDGLRDAAKASGRTVYALSQLSGLSQPPISRFLKGQRNLNTASIAKLARAVGFNPGPASVQSRTAEVPPVEPAEVGLWPHGACPVSFDDGGRPVINGKPKRVTKPQLTVIMALYEAGPRGLSGHELENKSGRGGYRVILATLARDEDWASAIRPAGGPRGRYRLALS